MSCAANVKRRRTGARYLVNVALVSLDPRPGTVYRLSSILLLTLLLLNLNLKLNFLLVHIATDSTFVALLAGFVERHFISFLLYCIVLYCKLPNTHTQSGFEFGEPLLAELPTIRALVMGDGDLCYGTLEIVGLLLLLLLLRIRATAARVGVRL